MRKRTPEERFYIHRNIMRQCRTAGRSGKQARQEADKVLRLLPEWTDQPFSAAVWLKERLSDKPPERPEVKERNCLMCGDTVRAKRGHARWVCKSCRYRNRHHQMDPIYEGHSG